MLLERVSVEGRSHRRFLDLRARLHAAELKGESAAALKSGPVPPIRRRSSEFPSYKGKVVLNLSGLFSCWDGGPGGPQTLATAPATPYIPAMFDAIRAELTSAGDKLAHLRRFL